MQEQQFIYCRPYLAKQFNPLVALIAGDLAYWLSVKGNRWSRRQDIADLFGVSEATVKRQRPHLDKIFQISRTTITKGNQKMPGANAYKLRPEYEHLKWRDQLTTPTTDMAADVLPFSLDYLELAQRATGKATGKANVDMAWFLCSLARVAHNSGHLTFTTWKALESWTQTTTRTAKRYLHQCAEAGLLTFPDESRPAIELTRAGRLRLLAPFVFLDNRRERSEKENMLARMEGMIRHLEEGIELGMGGPDVAEEKLIRYDAICQREFGISLLEHHARCEGYIDERGQVDTSRAFDSLVGY